MVNMARNGVPSDIFENKCRLCGATTIRKKHFLVTLGNLSG